MTCPAIAIVGDAFVDILAGIETLPVWGQDTPCNKPIQMQPGGSALNTATQLANLDKTRVQYHSVVGNDSFGEMLIHHLEKSNVENLSPILTNIPTGVCIVLTGNGDRGFVTHYGSSKVFNIQHINKEKLFQAKHIHIGGFYSVTGLIPDLCSLLHEAKSLGITTSLDTNYDGSEKWTHLDDILPLIDIFLPNEVEAKCISKCQSLDDAISYLTTLAPELTIVVKVGSEGVRGYNSKTKKKFQFRGYPTNVIDATGAGDAFNAGFLYAWTRTNDVDNALKWGCAVGSKCVQVFGACTNLPSYDILKELIEKN